MGILNDIVLIVIIYKLGASNPAINNCGPNSQKNTGKNNDETLIHPEVDCSAVDWVRI
jgi:hypothetical protein